MAKFSDFLAALGLAPKTLTDANAQLAAAKTSAESVAALFASAGLDLDALLAAGPDSLKAKLSEAGVLAVQLRADLETANAAKATAETSIAEALTAKAAAESNLAATHSALAAAGVKIDATKPVAESVPAAIEARISTKARELLAATGGLPLADTPAADATKPAAKIDPKLTGLARVQAEFAVQHAAANARRN